MRLSSFSSLGLFVAFFHLCDVSQADLVADFKNDPPIYCAAVNNEKDKTNLRKVRDIPVLGAAEAAAIPGLKLKQVQVMIRHGARTVARQRVCWPGYDPQWNCQSGEQVSAWVHEHLPSEPHPDDELNTFNFAKHYNARPRVNLMPNTNCELGQLVPAGYVQHDINGQVLYKTYFSNDDASKNLFDLKKTLTDKESMDGKIYFRSSEYQRTRMSGAQLLSSMVRAAKPDAEDPQIKLHVIEKDVDTIYPNEHWCYDLVDANKKAFSSDEYYERFWDKHTRARELSESMYDMVADPEGAGDWPFKPFDCSYTTICMNQNLPTGGNWTRENLEMILGATQDEFEWQFRANDALYSKIGFVRFVYDLKAFAIKHFCGATSTSETCVGQFFDDVTETRDMIEHLKSEQQIESNIFVLWSAHDNTLGPFLATFGDEFWKGASINYFDLAGYKLDSPFPSLASLLPIEFYERTSTDGPLFRMIYNGRVLTEFIPGCPAGKELCSVKTFFKAMNWANRKFALTPCTMSAPAATPCPDEPGNSGSTSFAPMSFAVLAGLALTQF